MPNVWFLGMGKRTISAKDWLDYGITAAATTWDASNGWSVDHATLTSDQLNILASMRSDFSLNQSGPRAWPSPDRPIDYQDSAYIYYARIVDLYNNLVEGTGRGSKWFSGAGLPGSIAGSIPGDFYLNTVTGLVYELS